VESAVIRLQRRAEFIEPALVARASRLADAAFAQRRKTIRNSMRSSAGIAASDLDAAFSAAGIDGDVRAETLAPESFVALARHLGQKT
jgi:16S rRNA (adenine1518-N6/adenine1519-N6)-dimethyltransferase